MIQLPSNRQLAQACFAQLTGVIAAGGDRAAGASSSSSPPHPQREHSPRLWSGRHGFLPLALSEGLADTLTLTRLGVTGALCRCLRATNLIESLNGQVAQFTHNVRRWRDGERGIAQRSTRRTRAFSSHSTAEVPMNRDDAAYTRKV